MSKRLKRKIQEACALTDLSREDKARRAQEILGSTDEKQTICNQILGVSFKDVERVMRDILAGVDSKSFEDELPEEKFGEVKPPIRQVVSAAIEEMLDPEYVNWLLNESSRSIAEVAPEPADPTKTPTYSEEEVAALMANNYHPAMFKYKK